MADPNAAAEHWRRVRRIVEVALDLPADERSEYVASEAGADDALLEDVLGLLELDGAAALEATLADAIDGSTSEAPDDDVERVGPWKLLRPIGSGGMGTVYLAARADGQFEKRVAVKRIKRGMDSDEVLRRFERERQVLASLDHPGIARLLDGGVGEDGRPYLVLEYVEGEPLDRWCDSRRLGVRERIELLCEICDAVDDAHRSLVVHRDLKPSNVLVDANGRPRLLDFGIAKVLDPDWGSQTIELTASSLRLLTPAYASPEQVLGQPITTASDVYSLGAVLYELLTGRPPFEFDRASASEVERAVCHAEPTRCSQAVGSMGPDVAKQRASSPRALARMLDGDLDTLVAKALRKEPRRRYANAAQLADDLRRYLRGLPVAARPDTFVYRTKKFVRRNRLAVGAAVATLLALLAGLGVSLWQFQKARTASTLLAAEVAKGEERNEALEALNAELEVEREAAVLAEGVAETQRAVAEQRASEVRDFATSLVFDVHRALVPVEGSLEAREEVLDLGLEYLQKVREESEDDPQFARELIGAYLRIAEIQGSDLADSFGDVEGALTSLSAAVELGESLQAADPESLPNDFALGSASLSYGDALVLAGRNAEAQVAYERAAQVCGIDESAPSQVLGREHVLAECLMRMGKQARETGDLAGAREILDRAMTRSEALARKLPPSRTKVAAVYFEMAQVERVDGDIDAALEFHERGLEVLETMLAAVPGQAQVERALASQRLAWGQLFLDAESPDEAKGIGMELVSELGAQAEADPRNVQPRRLLCAAYLLVARAEVELDGREEGLAAARAAEALAVELAELQPASGFALHDLGRAKLRLAHVHRSGGALLEAQECLQASCDAFDRYLERDPTSAFGARTLCRAQTVLSLNELDLAERGEIAASERRSWLERAESSLRETLETSNRLGELAASTAMDEALREQIEGTRERVARALESAGESR